jgi:NAD(P)H-hydrate epimerase
LADLPARSDEEKVKVFAKQFQCIVLLKGQQDIASNGQEVRSIEGGNEGMTKGGTGDVLAGLVAALACKNEPFLATLAGSFINKKTGDELYKTVGPFFNASDLAGQIPKAMKEFLL